jgi:Lyzozyme M1 (1,4-beta-N-acetylmuramidase)
MSRRVCAMAVLTALTIAVAGCDSDVATSPFPAPTDYAIQGIDVSKYQGDVDWNAVSASGVKFAWIKATEGGDYLDSKFRQNWDLSRAAGVRRGAYHFVYWCRPAEEQAAWFVANVPPIQTRCHPFSTSNGIPSHAPVRTRSRGRQLSPR